MRVEISRAEYRYIERRRKNINITKEVLEGILIMSITLMVIIGGSCFDSPNFKLVFTVFLALAAVALVAAVGVWILGGEL